MGTWKGMQCESTQGSMVSRRRQFVMTETIWKIIVRVFGDTACSAETLLFTVDFGSDYELGANSKTVPGAQETRFSFAHKLVTPTAAGVDFLKQRCDQYPWAPGTVQDIAKDGCGKLFVSIEACPVEYDLTAIADGTLRIPGWVALLDGAARLSRRHQPVPQHNFMYGSLVRRTFGD
jgi:hypothetical protein